jgi:FMN hydrolase / 5-amino-6-(5-phospho-D-ribitylamino)uracil phosphatase
MARPHIVLFDVMGTLVHEPFYQDVPRFFGMPLEELRRVRHPDAWIDFERGLIDEAEYARRFFLDGRVLDVEGLKRAMVEAYAWIDGMPELCAELVARRVPLHALSNYSPWYQLIEDKLDISRWVAWTFVSCHTGHRKPEPEAYLGAARALGVAAGDCFFVDDRPVNVDAARALGMPAHVFDGDVPALRAALRALDLLG